MELVRHRLLSMAKEDDEVMVDVVANVLVVVVVDVVDEWEVVVVGDVQLWLMLT
jgi:hypothetical protein